MSVSARETDVVIIGGGIAGISLAAELASHADVVVLEQEANTATHSSARSARQMQPSYGPANIRELTARSISLIRRLEEETGNSILTPRPLGWVASESGQQILERFCREVPSLRRIGAAELTDILPLAAAGSFNVGALDEHAFEVKVDVLLNHYQSLAEKQGAYVMTSAPVIKAAERSGRWTVETPAGTWKSCAVVDAAGAWADQVATACGIRPRDIQPYRRTVVIAEADLVEELQSAPMISDVEGIFYARPHGTSLLLSPSEAEPVEPSDVQPLPHVIEGVLQRAGESLSVQTGVVKESWAGLRSFSREGTPLVGWDEDVPGFFWLAGHGGYGIQTSPALAEDAAAAILQGLFGKTPARRNAPAEKRGCA